MKYLNDYTEKATSELFDRMGAFFAFSKKQFEAEEKEGVKYISLGAGMVCPECNAVKLVDSMDTIIQDAIKQDLAENGKDGVIKRELANHECYYTGDISDCVDKLTGYEITRDEIFDIFIQEAPKQEFN